MGKPLKDIMGIRYTGESSNSNIVFVSPIYKAKIQMSSKMTQQANKHYCGQHAHIWPYYHKLYGKQVHQK